MVKPIHLVLGLLAAVAASSFFYISFDSPAPAPTTVATVAVAPTGGAPASESRSSSTGLIGAETPEEAARAAYYRAEHERSAEDNAASMQAVPAPLPLALREIAPSVGLGVEQAAAVYMVREQFLQTMKNAGDPNSPEYAARWMAAQQQADDALVAYLGGETISRLQLRPE